MEKKKGNTILIAVVFVFMFTTIVFSFVFINHISNKKVSNFCEESKINRNFNEKVYTFYISEVLENEEFIRIDNLIILKSNSDIKYLIYVEDNIIKIKKEETK